MWLRVAALLLALGTSSAAAAADMCWYDGTGQFLYRFQNLKLPKKEGTVAPLVGQALSGVSATGLPLYGTVLRDQNTSAVMLTFTRHIQACLVLFVLDPESLDGNVSYDCNFDAANDGTFALDFVPTCQLN